MARKRDEERWQNLDQQQRTDEEKWQKIREEGSRAFRNKSSVPFNPITLTYNADEAGQKLHRSDELVKERAAKRAIALRNHSCRSGVNPITGEPL